MLREKCATACDNKSPYIPLSVRPRCASDPHFYVPGAKTTALDLARDPQPPKSLVRLFTVTIQVPQVHRSVLIDGVRSAGQLRSTSELRGRVATSSDIDSKRMCPARRPGQGQQGPLRPALASTARAAARVLASQGRVPRAWLFPNEGPRLHARWAAVLGYGYIYESSQVSKTRNPQSRRDS